MSLNESQLKAQRDLTFKHNLTMGRHSWLRLTPAYSVKLVNQILDENLHVNHLLDPFCGTGTTSLACAERGINSTSLDINPFLIWFARIKTSNHNLAIRQKAQEILLEWKQNPLNTYKDFIPPIQHIERWWSPDILDHLSAIHTKIMQVDSASVRDLFLIAFCQLVIETSNAAFNHQSMSFKSSSSNQLSLFELDTRERLWEQFINLTENILDSCVLPLLGNANIIQADARAIPALTSIDCVITSPPYPNRMSYIRELRPYMYWLGFLKDTREAGELDWQAIGGTWGIATSRVSKWRSFGQLLPYPKFENLIADISNRSPTLANYVHKYFEDVFQHLSSLQTTLVPGATVHYIVGNSKFYDTLVSTEQIYAAFFSELGFRNVQVNAIRKRNSKKELVEFIVYAQKG